jgi:hypothetical protein
MRTSEKPRAAVRFTGTCKLQQKKQTNFFFHQNTERTSHLQPPSIKWTKWWYLSHREVQKFPKTSGNFKNAPLEMQWETIWNCRRDSGKIFGKGPKAEEKQTNRRTDEQTNRQMNPEGVDEALDLLLANGRHLVFHFHFQNRQLRRPLISAFQVFGNEVQMSGTHRAQKFSEDLHVQILPIFQAQLRPNAN